MRLDAEAAPTEASQLRIWQQFQRRGGILIGTQLLIKGVGQVRAAVVGAVGIDAALNLPDFRAAERVHQVLTRLLRLRGGTWSFRPSRRHTLRLWHSGRGMPPSSTRGDWGAGDASGIPRFGRVGILFFRG